MNKILLAEFILFWNVFKYFNKCDPENGEFVDELVDAIAELLHALYEKSEVGNGGALRLN